MKCLTRSILDDFWKPVILREQKRHPLPLSHSKQESIAACYTFRSSWIFWCPGGMVLQCDLRIISYQACCKLFWNIVSMGGRVKNKKSTVTLNSTTRPASIRRLFWVDSFLLLFCFGLIHFEAPNRCPVIKQIASSHHQCRWRATVLPMEKAREDPHTAYCSILFSSAFSPLPAPTLLNVWKSVYLKSLC